MSNQFPKLHNAMWPGLVGKGQDSEPAIDLDTMLDLTAQAEVNGVKFDGVDVFLFEPHISIDMGEDDLKRLADKIASRGFVVGSVVAPVWPPTGGGSAMGTDEERKLFVQQVLKACRIASKLRELGVRPYGIVRIDSATGVESWAADPENNTKRIAQTFRESADIARSFGERLAAEGEICWGGMHSWREMVRLLEYTDRPDTVGFQADMAHTLLYTLGYNAGPAERMVPANFNWEPAALDAALRQLTAALRPWTIDFHVAQNDATVHGTGSHDKTGRHCQVNDPNGKLNVAHHAGFWLRDDRGQLTKAVRHICWDGCMFPNAVMYDQQTWNNILAAMISVRDAHGWNDDDATEDPAAPPSRPVRLAKSSPSPGKPKSKSKLKSKPKSQRKPARVAAAQRKPKSNAKAKTKAKAKAKARARVKLKTTPPKARSRPRRKLTTVKARKPAKRASRKGRRK